MDRFKRLMLVFLLGSGLFFPLATVAKNESFEQKVADIEQMGDKSKALEKVNLLLTLPDNTPNQLITASLAQAGIYVNLLRFEDAITVLSLTQTLAIKNNNQQQQADVNKLQGVAYYYKGEYPQSLAAYQASLVFYQVIDAPIQQANLLNNIALVQTSMGRISSALESYQIAESIYQDHGSEMDLNDIKFNIAGMYVSLKRFDIAIRMFINVIEKRKELHDEYGVAKASADLGIAYQYSGKYHLAEQYILESLKYFDSHNQQFDLASQLHNLSEIYNFLDKPSQARKYAEQGAVLSLQIGHKKAYVGSLHSLAKALFRLGYIDEALEKINISNKISKEMDYKAMTNDNLALLSLIYAAQNKTAIALSFHLAYLRELTNTENEMLNIQISRFEAEKLSHQVDQLKQKERLQQLQQTKNDQQSNFIILAVLLFLLTSFLIYRRQVERWSKQKLETQVKERTQELEILAIELQQANTVKGQFLANISHEMRTPLTAVIGQAEAILNGDIENNDIDKEVKIIQSNGLHLLQLINDILDLSKIEENKLELEIKPQDLSIIIEELSDIFTEQATKKGLLFEIRQTLSSPLIVNIDGFRLKQILINFCSNAIKFTPRGKVVLTVSLEDDNLVFTVIDTGIGMSETQLNQVFDSFIQGDNTISRRFGGSGLGLFLSQKLAQMMGGTISVESCINHGSIFTFSLPFSSVSLATMDTCLSKPIIELPQPLVKYSGQILLADDHDDNRRLIARILTRLGLEVLTASNGQEAVDLFLDNKPLVILLDIQMPEMDGIQAFKKLREYGCRQPIFALTANAMSHEIDEYLAIGFNGHLKKPIERDIFISTITRYYQTSIATFPDNNLVDNDLVKNHLVKNDVESDQLINVDFSDLILSFTANLEKDLQDIIKHAENNDLKQLSHDVHRLAGAAQMFGFHSLADKAIKLESCLKANKLNPNIDVIDELTQRLLYDIDQILQTKT